ncbi:MAG: sensor histidine kinase KdpD [Planctomycetota bacterium]|nr:sensor histidine kinase KdpD [Planctomycetota bacterium]
MTDDRPNPDLLLARVQEEETKARKGKLKVFFGAAAGVGKTYAMLEEGRAKAAEGADVVVGYAEQHIRTETEALLLGLDLLPYKIVDYRGTKLKEFDLDAALTRKPALLLIDELAHTNAPGMRHTKRWQDVMECLDAGIDVYTTLNVQHLESLNDVVERLTGIAVRETLPDSVLEKADEIELVDTSPEELLERLKEGKVYIPQQAQTAIRNFFTRGNLIALRELAMRKAAEQVDVQMRDFRRIHALKGAWTATERLLVCVGPSPLSVRLVRATRRLAMGLRAEWIAAYVETPASGGLSQADRDRLTHNMRLAEQLGATTVTLSGQNVAEELLAYAQAHDITKIVVGKPDQSRWREMVFGSIVDQLVRGSGDIDIYVIRGKGEQREPEPAKAKPKVDWPGYAWSVAVVALATLVGWPLYHSVGLSNTNVLMLYLLGVLWIATHKGRGPAILASVLGVAAFDLCFVPPYLTFSVADQQYLVTFMVMLLTALVISTLTDRARKQGQAARQRERRTAALYALSRELAGTRGTDPIIQIALRHVAEYLDTSAAILLPDQHGHLVLRGHIRNSHPVDEKEQGVAQWVYEHEERAGVGTATLPAARGLYLPLIASRGSIGVLGVFPSRPRQYEDPEHLHLLEAFANQAALAIERAILAEEAEQAWERVEAEFLRNTLLSAVSHDLRTPLAGITGAASSLTEMGNQLTEEVRGQMLDTISEEARRMERLINNLLDMTRLESGGLHLKKEWHPIEEVIGAALHDLERGLKGRQVKIAVPPDMPLVQLDGVAIEQVLVNLLDNAVEYTPDGTSIEITARRTEQGVAIEVADRGPGLPAGTEARVFEKFFRVRSGESRRGIGLGLAICKGIVEAHGGTIGATNREGGGASFRFTLPLGGEPPKVDNLA